jgi:hypothetical protein
VFGKLGLDERGQLMIITRSSSIFFGKIDVNPRSLKLGGRNRYYRIGVTESSERISLGTVKKREGASKPIATPLEHKNIYSTLDSLTEEEMVSVKTALSKASDTKSSAMGPHSPYISGIRFKFNHSEIKYVETAEEEGAEPEVVAVDPKEPAQKRRKSDRIAKNVELAKTVDSGNAAKSTAKPTAKSTRTQIKTRKILDVSELVKDETRMFRFSQFVFATSKNMMMMLRHLLRVVDSDVDLPADSKMSCKNLSDSEHMV